MAKLPDYESKDPIAWCPGCGNFGILEAVKQALTESNLEPYQILMVSGIGQAAKLPHYVKCNLFNGLHGRTLPVATAAKITNHKLTVIGVSGDGDAYGEGEITSCMLYGEILILLIWCIITKFMD